MFFILKDVIRLRYIEQNQDKICLNSTTFHLLTEQHVSTDLGHISGSKSLFFENICVNMLRKIKFEAEDDLNQSKHVFL
jgi:hypothetical protein